MASAFDIERWILVFSLIVHLLGVVEWHYLITFAVNDVNWALYVGHAVDIRELIYG